MSRRPLSRSGLPLAVLDTTLELDAPNKAELERAMQGHVLARAELVGTYQKSGR